MSIEWNDSYKIGDPEVDQQHQYLFELTNEFIAADSLGDMRSLMIQLYKHTREHFEREEELMRRVKFPGLALHQEQHNQLLRRLSELSMDVGKGYMNKPAIIALMTDWATRHIPLEDAQVVAFMAKQP
ncbi:MAG: hemerythrin family protein [Rhodoferax sp.]|nr:hemerythrin family protein [Rhodoferax sp.]